MSEGNKYGSPKGLESVKSIFHRTAIEEHNKLHRLYQILGFLTNVLINKNYSVDQIIEMIGQKVNIPREEIVKILEISQETYLKNSA